MFRFTFEPYCPLHYGTHVWTDAIRVPTPFRNQPGSTLGVLWVEKKYEHHNLPGHPGRTPSRSHYEDDVASTALLYGTVFFGGGAHLKLNSAAASPSPKRNSVVVVHSHLGDD